MIQSEFNSNHPCNIETYSQQIGLNCGKNLLSVRFIRKSIVTQYPRCLNSLTYSSYGSCSERLKNYTGAYYVAKRTKIQNIYR